MAKPTSYKSYWPLRCYWTFGRPFDHVILKRGVRVAIPNISGVSIYLLQILFNSKGEFHSLLDFS